MLFISYCFHIDSRHNQVDRNNENLEDCLDHFDMYHKYMDFLHHKYQLNKTEYHSKNFI
jgi:hypothetical protein